MSPVLEVLIVLLLILLNGLFAMAEFAIVSGRKSRLQDLARQGDKGAETALNLSRDPAGFLSTVQIGITLIGVLSGAFGGATVARSLAIALSKIPELASSSEELAIAIVVVFITFLTLVLGELAPKRLALNQPEAVAVRLAPLMKAIAWIASPLVSLLSRATNLLLSILGQDTSHEAPVTEEEIRILIAQATESGEILEAEEDMVAGIFRLGDRRISSLMTPRTEIEWLDLNDPVEKNLHKMSSGEYSSYPAAYDDLDKVVGVISVKSLLGCCLAGKKLNFEDYISPAVFVPENSIALKVLEIFRSTESKMVLVINEYGGVQGLLTVRDILQSVIGVFQASDLMQEPHILKRSDGSWLVDGATPVDEFMDAFNLSDLPEYERGHYETMGGFILNQMGKIPTSGESFGWSGMRFEIVDMDGLRVDKILIRSTAKAPGPAKGL